MTARDAADAQQRVQDGMQKLINDIDKSHLRKIQMRMHQCAAKCCGNESASLEETHRCIEECSSGVSYAQNYVQTEIGGVQERMQRCVLDCQDKAKDNMGVNPSETLLEKTKGDFEKCAIDCVDNNLKCLPALLKRMKATLDQNAK